MAEGVEGGVREVEGGDMTLQSLQTAIVADCSPDSFARDRFIMHSATVVAIPSFDVGLWRGYEKLNYQGNRPEQVVKREMIPVFLAHWLEMTIECRRRRSSRDKRGK